MISHGAVGDSQYSLPDNIVAMIGWRGFCTPVLSFKNATQCDARDFLSLRLELQTCTDLDNSDCFDVYSIAGTAIIILLLLCTTLC